MKTHTTTRASQSPSTHPASKIGLILFDVDGVLTDGAITYDDRGSEIKRFNVRDGLAIKAAMSIGYKIGAITGRSSRAVTLRMSELGIDLFAHGVANKASALQSLCEDAGVPPEEAAYLGDDLIDLPALLRCGYPMAVADAVEEVLAVAKFTTHAKGGQAAARETIHHILHSQNRWEELVEKFGV